ncbi:hypothetical protein [Peribacillus frigoritolerans]|nr:hypothetical protein [Peribacillus frigoritolerans]MCM3166723.1 hypothetical protein [Peribacillus frigoritolerans]
MEMPKGVRNGLILIPSHDCIGMITMILMTFFVMKFALNVWSQEPA